MSVITLITKAGEQIYGQISGKSKANELYRVLVPELKEAIEAGKPLADPQVQRLINAIGQLPSSGVKRMNFQRRYLEDADAMLRLPHDPETIMYGYWW